MLKEPTSTYTQTPVAIAIKRWNLRRERVVPVAFPGSLRPMAFTTNTLMVYILEAIRLVRVADWRDASPEKFWDPESSLVENTISTPVMGLFPLLPFVQLTSSVLVPGEVTSTFVGVSGGTVCVCVCVCVCGGGGGGGGGHTI